VITQYPVSFSFSLLAAYEAATYQMLDNIGLTLDIISGSMMK
jgi:hypothetical protein